MPGVQVAGRLGVEPGGHLVEARDLGTGVAVELGVGLELGHPPGDLAFEEAVGVAEVGEADGLVVDRAEGGDAVDHRQAHLVADGRVAGVEIGQGRRSG